MQYVREYHSQLGPITLAGDGQYLTGVWFGSPEDCAGFLSEDHNTGSLPVLRETEQWLDIYFSGREPDFMPAVRLSGSAFRMAVWKILQDIPYGQTVTYGEIAERIAAQMGGKKMSARAVGGAVGHNPVSILVPCHRVVGTGGNLTGYSGGMDKKVRLLALEGVDMTNFFVPGR